MTRHHCTCGPLGTPLCVRCATLLQRHEASIAFKAPSRPQVATSPSRLPGELGETEKAFMARVVAFAKGRGWLAYHTHDSRHSPEGFPDLVLCNGQATLFAELKAARGKLSLAQQQWVGLLDHAGQAVYVWRPGDWAQIVALLTAAPTQRLGDRDE